MAWKRDACLFVLVLAWPVVLATPSGPSMSDSVLLAAIRLVDDGTWTLSDEPDARIVFQTEAFDISVHQGRAYSGVGPGASALAAPFYLLLKPALSRFDERVIANRRFLGYYAQNRRRLDRPGYGRLKDIYLLQIVLAWLVCAPLLASLAVRLHRRAADAGRAPAPASVVALALGLGSMALYYSAMYSRPALAYGFAGHAVLTLSGWKARTPPTWAACLAAGLLLGAAVAIDYASAILVALCLAFFLSRLPRPARLATVLPVLAVLAATAAYHRAAFGSAFTTPYHFRFWSTPPVLLQRGLDLAPFRDNPAVAAHLPSPRVMVELCFGSYKGLFVYSPVLLLGLAGHLAGLRRPGHRRFHGFALAVFLSYLALNATLGAGDPEQGRLAWGGLSTLWGPRHLYAVVPFLALGLTALDWRRAWLRRLAYVLLVFSSAVNVAGAMFSDVVMSTYALGPELQAPLAYTFDLLRARGPRVPLLDAYHVSAPVQWAVLVALGALSGFLLRRPWRSQPRVDAPAERV
jgi:hypothetical protein